MPIVDPICSSDSVWRGTDMSRSISDDLSTIEAGLANKAASDHTHQGFASTDHAHTGYADATHSHTEYASSGHSHSDLASSDHTHTGFAVENHSHTEYASSSHDHSGYASSGHSHTASEVGAASFTHSHSEYASSSHSHSGYASSSHNHDSDYLPASGDVNVDGVLRVESQQAFYYNSSSGSQTIGSGNAASTTIANGSSATTAINGALVKVPTLVPKSSGSFYCGNANFRWQGIYSTSAVNVSSDARKKRDIVSLDNQSLADFVDMLNVVSYNYIDDNADQKSRIGLIAQDVQAADAELAKFFVNEDEDGFLSMTPADLVFALISTVQVMQREIAELKSRLG